MRRNSVRVTCTCIGMKEVRSSLKRVEDKLDSLLDPISDEEAEVLSKYNEDKKKNENLNSK